MIHVKNGALATLALVIAAIPFGVVYGALAENAGLNFMLTIGMSALVFGGASQFIAVTLLTGGAAYAVIVATIFVVNLRHMLYSANLMPHVKHWPQRWRIPLSFILTDETFAAVSNHIHTAFFAMLLCYDWPYQLGLLFTVLVSVLVGVLVEGKS